MSGRGLIRRALRAIALLALLGLAWSGYVQWLIHTAEQSDDREPVEAGIVLGAALWNDRPSPALRERLNHAADLYRAGRFAQIIVSGGLDANGSTITEAEGMAEYLIERGIPASSIYAETRSTSTYENLAFSRAVMEENGWRRAIIVTHDYHGARALDIAEFLGYEQPAVSLMSSEVMWMPWHKARETLAFTKWTLKKAIMLLQ